MRKMAIRPESGLVLALRFTVAVTQHPILNLRGLGALEKRVGEEVELVRLVVKLQSWLFAISCA